MNKNEDFQTAATALVSVVGGVTSGAPELESSPPPSLCTPAVCLGKWPPLSEPLAHLQSGAVLAASQGG